MNAADELRRWEDAGGHWRLVEREEDRVTLALLSCDGGEEMSRVTAPVAELEELLADRTTSEDG